ncbi:hypothetical protein BJ742DRAFT_745358, partial [Cladochytrium replicatum]
SGQNYNYQQAPQTSALYHDYPAQQMPMGAGQSPVGDANSSRLIAAPMPVKASVQVAPTNLMTMIASPPPTERFGGSNRSDRRASSYMSAPRISRVVDENFFRESVFMSDTLGRNTVTIVPPGVILGEGRREHGSRREPAFVGERKRTSMVGSMAGSEGGKQLRWLERLLWAELRFWLHLEVVFPRQTSVLCVFRIPAAATTSTIQSIVNPSPSSNIPLECRLSRRHQVSLALYRSSTVLVTAQPTRCRHISIISKPMMKDQPPISMDLVQARGARVLSIIERQQHFLLWPFCSWGRGTFAGKTLSFPHLPQYRDVSSGSHQVIAGPSRIDGSTSPARMSQAEARRIVDDAFSKNVNLRRGDTIMTNASSVDRSSPYDSDTNDGEILDSLGDRRTSDATTVMTSGSGKRTSVIKQQPRDQ